MVIEPTAGTWDPAAVAAAVPNPSAATDGGAAAGTEARVGAATARPRTDASRRAMNNFFISTSSTTRIRTFPFDPGTNKCSRVPSRSLDVRPGTFLCS